MVCFIGSWCRTLPVTASAPVRPAPLFTSGGDIGADYRVVERLHDMRRLAQPSNTSARTG